MSMGTDGAEDTISFMGLCTRARHIPSLFDFS